MRRKGIGSLRIVILAQEVTPELRVALKTQLGTLWRPHQIVLRSGSSLILEHLHRVNALEASTIIVPGADFALGGAKMTDARVVKTLMSLASFSQTNVSKPLPPVVAEIFDAQKHDIALQAYPGQADLISSDSFISQLLVQCTKHSGLLLVYAELLSHAIGNEIYVRAFPEVIGRCWYELRDAFPKAIPIGVVRPSQKGFVTFLNPELDFTIKAEDSIALIAQTFEEAHIGTLETVNKPAVVPSNHPQPTSRRLLILGWSHKAPSLIEIFAADGNEVKVDLMSLVPPVEREASLARVPQPQNLLVRHLLGDYTQKFDLQQLELTSYDSIIFLGSDWLDSDEASDARTVLGYVLLMSLLPKEASTRVLVELMDPDNEHLFTDKESNVVISSFLLSHMAAQTALRPELGSVYEALLKPGGFDIVFRSAKSLNLSTQPVTFKAIKARLSALGEIALGIRLSSQEQSAQNVHLNPKAESKWTLRDADDIVVLSAH